jgi:hypothetical protein
MSNGTLLWLPRDEGEYDSGWKRTLADDNQPCEFIWLIRFSNGQHRIGSISMDNMIEHRDPKQLSCTKPIAQFRAVPNAASHEDPSVRWVFP